MVYDPNKHHRRSLRLKGYDYSQPEAYFVTICVQDHACLLGQISGEEMICTDAGKMAARWRREIHQKFPTVEIAVLVEPDHVGADLRVRPVGGTNSGKLWQRNYYEHIIRDENEWNQIRNYIIQTPMNWKND